MNSTALRTAAALAAAVAVASTAQVAVPAPARAETASHVTVRTSDATPASGETFRLSGAVWSGGARVPARIRVKTYRRGEWVVLSGAQMMTDRDNRYTIRIVLQMRGERMLRVVGDPVRDGIATARRTITVTVH